MVILLLHGDNLVTHVYMACTTLHHDPASVQKQRQAGKQQQLAAIRLFASKQADKADHRSTAWCMHQACLPAGAGIYLESAAVAATMHESSRYTCRWQPSTLKLPADAASPHRPQGRRPFFLPSGNMQEATRWVQVPCGRQLQCETTFAAVLSHNEHNELTKQCSAEVLSPELRSRSTIHHDAASHMACRA